MDESATSVVAEGTAGDSSSVDKLRSGYFRLDPSEPTRTKLVHYLSVEEIERRLLMARAAKPLLETSHGTLLILDSAEKVLIGEGPDALDLHDATLTSVARTLKFSDSLIEDIHTALRASIDTGQTCKLEEWAPPLRDLSNPYSSDSRRFEVHVARLSADDDLLPTVACLLVDVTEMVKARTADERVQKERLNVFLGSISDAVLATDSDWGIVYLNPSAMELLQTGEPEARGRSLWNVASIDVCLTNRPLQELVQAEDCRQSGAVLDCRLCLANGSYKIVTVRIRNYSGTEEWNSGYVVVLHDVTEERRQTHQDILSRKMETMGQLAAGIAHEINTPMQFVNDNTRFFATSLATLTDIISSRLKLDEGDDDVRWTLEELPNALKETRDGIDRVIKIVSAMKEFSHPSGESKCPSDLNRGITATTTVARNSWKYTANLELDLAEDLPLVFCNLDEVNQVVLNLVLNAVDAIKEKQQRNSSVELGHIAIRTTVESSDVILSIWDDGTGLSEEVKVKMFDPFFTTKPVGKGTGQGLALAHDVIVKKHGGSIDVESEVGRGTCF